MVSLVDESFIIIPEYIDEASMSWLKTDNKKRVVATELEKFLGMLKGVKSKTTCIPEPMVVFIPPYEIIAFTDRQQHGYYLSPLNKSQEGICILPQ